MRWREAGSLGVPGHPGLALWALLLLLLLLLLPALTPAHAAWWFMSQLSASYTSTRVHCKNIPGLVRRQRVLCNRHPDAMMAVTEGAVQGVRHCQKQFQDARWNCSTIPRDASVFGRHVLKSTRESAFVYSINSAGVVHAVTRACSRGAITNCACDLTKKGIDRDWTGQFTWGGCSDNIRYGTAFARKFIDARDRGQRDSRALMNLHNNRAGRKGVRKKMRLECKCHGVSGSCTVRTCWQTLAPFGATARWLKGRYDEATEVSMLPSGEGLVPRFGEHEAPRKKDLVYLESSPDYCLADSSYGFTGTGGRQCNVTSRGPDGCDLLCCGRGYDTHRRLITTKCECKFQWCCSVDCKTCESWRDLHFCKPWEDGAKSTASPL
ncbi:protein Wnt-2b-A-like isoform X2 [Portunus trituberculatus]|uniref:protein Wnt-2b-A-like isoform X2 n=1 Tax=Portunus trituberculatus TaxID=210409 RepID=UPI001E1CDA1D|nr:protein Wnt-2b-A-like isoform X2 [Portunus trituberculatus]